MAHPSDLHVDAGRIEPAQSARGPSLLRLVLVIPEFLCALVLATLVVFLVVSVFSRYAMNLGMPWSDEVARLLFAWLVLIGFAIAVRHRANVGVDWLVRKLPPRGLIAVAALQDLMVLAFSGLFTWEAWVTVRFAMIQRMPALDITIAWMYGSALAAGVLMVIYAAANLAETLRGRMPKGLLDIPSEIRHAE